MVNKLCKDLNIESPSFEKLLLGYFQIVKSFEQMMKNCFVYD